MNYYFITGTSKGLGKAIAKKLLNKKNTKVIGLSRSNSIIHPNYTHVSIDLSKVELIENVLLNVFTRLIIPEKIVLINNSGALGDVKHIGNTNAKNIQSVFNLNTIAPAILMNSFIKQYEKTDSSKTIINISSGAGKSAIDGWSSYCASKAALDMLSQTASVEENINNNGFKIYSVAPGVVDTEMQAHIRKANENDFSMLQKFKDYKPENELKSPEEVADMYLYLLDNEKQFKESVLSVRDF